jgi:hypothetical protein
MSRRALSGVSARSAGFRVVMTPEIAQVKDIPAPVGGLNAVSPIAAMKPTDAITLTNMFPQPGWIEIRRGHAVHVDLDPQTSPVQSLMAYNALDPADDKLFAVASAGIYDVTVELSATASAVFTGLGSPRVQHTNMATSGGNFLWCANGANAPIYYDGSAWATASITGVTAADIIAGTVYKSRMWLTLRDSLSPAYLEPDSIQGTATPFDLQGVFTKGGFLQAIGSWSLDGGDGPDDYLALVSSRGEVAVYSGTGPGESDFGLRGVFSMGAPIGRRCLTKMGADLAVISVDGIVPLSKALITDRAAVLTAALSAKIQPLVNQAARDSGSNFGWQLIAYPKGTRAILNVPVQENTQQIQYVMNTITGAWCKFEGENANCWEVFQDNLYFGGNAGVVYKADAQGIDEGADFSFGLETAFNKLSSDRLKQFTMCRSLLTTDNRLRPGIALNIDFARGADIDQIALSESTQALWDVASWDQDVWPEVVQILTDWIAVDGLGTWASIRMAGNVTEALADSPGNPLTMQVNGFQVQFLPGGIL